jgi:hypothetical protein
VTATPIFILGFPRSGTTLLGQILASRPGTVLLEEQPLLALGIADFFDTADGPLRLTQISDAGLDPYRDDFWARARSLGLDPRSDRLVDQTALNTAYLPLILRLFPQSPVIFALRDPRDVVFGCFRRRFAPNRFTLELSTLEGAARLYCEAMQLAQTCRQRLGFAPLEIRNEDLIADPEGQTRRLCSFTALPWDSAIHRFHETAPERTLSTASSHQVRRGIDARGVGHWRRYAAQMAPILPLLRPWVGRFGYPPD